MRGTVRRIRHRPGQAGLTPLRLGHPIPPESPQQGLRGNVMPDHASAANATVALRLAEAFARHGVTLTFGQSLPSAFHLASPHVGIEQKVYRQDRKSVV